MPKPMTLLQQGGRPPTPLMKRRAELYMKLEKLIGDDAIAGVKTSWGAVAEKLARVTTPELISLVYRIERALALADENGQARALGAGLP